MILEGTNSGEALAVAGVAKEKNKVFLDSGAATSDLTGAQCNANTVHWVFDTYMLSHSTGGAMVKAGGDTWYFIVADYAFGHALQRDTTEFVQQAGGKVLGSVLYPFPSTTDFSSFLVQAQASGAKVLGLASAGADAINLDQAGARVRHPPCAGRAADLSLPTCTRWVSRWRRAGADRQLLLGPECRHAAVRRPIYHTPARQAADHGACGGVFERRCTI